MKISVFTLFYANSNGIPIKMDFRLRGNDGSSIQVQQSDLSAQSFHVGSEAMHSAWTLRMTDGLHEAFVSGKQGRVAFFGDSYVPRIVGCDVLAQFDAPFADAL